MVDEATSMGVCTAVLSCATVGSLWCLLIACSLGSSTIRADPIVGVGEDGHFHINTMTNTSHVVVNGIDVQHLYNTIAAQQRSIQELLNTTTRQERMLADLRPINTGCSSTPPGSIMAWYGSVSSIPAGYALCNGSNGTPDLRGRFILGVSESHHVNSTGGEEEVTLTMEQMPRHDHHSGEYNRFVDEHPENQQGGLRQHFSAYNGRDTRESEPRGGDEPHNNMPPYHALHYIMKL